MSTAYPNREHQNADKAATRRALKALDEIIDHARLVRRRVENGASDGSDTHILSDEVRKLTVNLGILEALRDVREWHAADLVAKED